MIINPYVFGGGGGDPYWANVALLLHMDGTNASTTFTDSSSYARTCTAVGAAQLTTSVKKFGTASGIWNGAAAAVTVPDSASLEYGSGDFTVEMWVRRAGSVAFDIWIDKRATPNGAGYAPLIMYNNSSGNVGFLVSVNGSSYGINYLSGSNHCPLDSTFRHTALCRSGDDFHFYWDGTRLTTQNISGTLYDNGNALVIGAADPAGYLPHYGYLDDVRITIGVARYTGSTLTVPTAAFPDS